jgi:hypothetical protein
MPRKRGRRLRLRGHAAAEGFASGEERKLRCEPRHRRDRGVAKCRRVRTPGAALQSLLPICGLKSLLGTIMAETE